MRALEERLAAAQAELAAATARGRAARRDAARGPRPDRRPQGRDRPAGPAAVRLRRLPRAVRRRHRRHLHRPAASCGSRSARRSTVDDLRRGQEVMLNEAMNVVRALEFERVGEVVMLKEMLEDGDRALVVGHTDEERVVHLADDPARRSRCAPATRCCSSRAPATSTSGSPRARSRSSSSKRSPTSTTPTSVAWPRRSRRSATPSSCRSCTPTCSASTSCARRRASCCTARPAAARR